MKIELNNSKLAFALALPVFVYINIRAAVLAFTYDECWTYLGYATEDFWKVVTNEFAAANNHVLHSLAMGFIYDLFGQHEYALRLPVLLSFIVFAFFSYKISKKLSNEMWWLPFTMVIYQPYILDYFVAARGYALAMACMFGALYFTYKFVEKSSLKWVWISLLFSALAAYSNFTYLLFFIANSIGLLAVGFDREKFQKVVLAVATSGALLTAVVYRPISALIAAKELYYGGHEGFFNDTLSTLAKSFVYSADEVNFLTWTFAVIIALAGMLALQKLVWKEKLNMGFWLTFVLITIEIGSILQHHLLGSPYLVDRTALFFIPLLLFSLSWLIFQLKKGVVLNVTASLCVLLTVVNLFASANLTYLLDFKEYADTEKAMLMIADDSAVPKGAFTIGKSIYMNAPINFYRVKHGLERIHQSGLEFCDESEDTKYYYLFEKDIACIEDKEVKLMHYFPVSRTYLYRVI